MQQTAAPSIDASPTEASRIVEVQARTIHIPLDRTTTFATRTISGRDYALVRAKTEDGHEGLGFRYGGNTAGILVADVVRELLRPVLIGQDANRVEGLWQQMYSEVLLQARLGSVMRAISIVDVALWDRNARAARLPLHRYLGAVADDRVPAYTIGGYYLDGKSANDLGEEMAGYVVLGFRAVKNGNSDVG